MKKLLFIITAIILLIISAGGVYYFIYTGTPQYSVIMIIRSIKTHDWEKFRKYVDIDEVSGNLVDKGGALLGEFIDSNSGETGGRFKKKIAEKIGDLIKPQITEGIKKGLEKFIKEGDVKKEPDSSLKKKLILNSKLTCEKQEGETAIVSLDVKDGERDINIRLRMKKKEGYWQLAEILNPEEIIKDVMAGKMK